MSTKTNIGIPANLGSGMGVDCIPSTTIDEGGHAQLVKLDFRPILRSQEILAEPWREADRGDHLARLGRIDGSVHTFAATLVGHGAATSWPPRTSVAAEAAH